MHRSPILIKVPTPLDARYNHNAKLFNILRILFSCVVIVGLATPKSNRQHWENDMAIKTPYELQLRDLLKDVYETGMARVEWRILKRWLNVIRVTNRVWEELQERWVEIIEQEGKTSENDKAWRLGHLDWDTDHCKQYLTLICMDPKRHDQDEDEDASWVPVENYL